MYIHRMIQKDNTNQSKKEVLKLYLYHADPGLSGIVFGNVRRRFPESDHTSGLTRKLLREISEFGSENRINLVKRLVFTKFINLFRINLVKCVDFYQVNVYNSILPGNKMPNFPKIFPGYSVFLGGENMQYKDFRIHSFNLSPDEANELYNKRYNGESTIRLGFDIKGSDSFVVLNPELSALIFSIYQGDKKLTLLSSKISAYALDQFVDTSMIEEIQQSNEVENVNSTRKEIKDALDAVSQGRHGKRFVSMVRKYLILQSDKDIPLSTCQDIRSLYDDFIADEVVREDPEDQPDGEIFRKSPVHVDNGHGQSIHEGLFPESKIITAMDSALSILNNENYDILIRVALYHYFFGYIHPFYNGNGRMTRFISSYMLAKYFSKSACLRISYVIKEHRSRYYELFKNANDKRNRGELTEFVMGYLTFFKEAIDGTYVTLEEKNKLYQEYEKLLDGWIDKNMNKLSFMQRFSFKYILQADLFGDSSMDISRITYMMECSEKTARKILSDAGPLVKTTKDGRKLIWHINLETLSSEEN